MNCRAPLTVAFLTALAASTALAQPKFVVTSLNSDIDSTGNKSLGLLLEWSPGPTAAYVPYTYQRGVGFTRIPGVSSTPSFVKGSSDFSALVSDLPNTSNWGNLNCFAGYCFGSMEDCTPGDPLPPPNPCNIPVVAHRWTQGTGWFNAGSLPRLQDAGSGRYYGGTRCDGNINYPHDISGNGRYIVGGAYWAPLTTASGGPGFGLCGNFYAFRFDAQTNAFTALPSASNSTTTRADYVSNDGSVITGFDLGPVSDGQGGFYDGRRTCVWTNGVQTLLDSISDNSSLCPVNGTGTTIAGAPGPDFNKATFGTGGIKLVKWVRQPNNSWTPQNLGRPVDRDHGLAIDVLVALYPAAISDDGNTIVGTAQYNELGPGGLSRLFIWRPTINGGKPIDLLDYIASIDPTNALLQDGLLLTIANGISADGNAIGASLYDGRNTCTNGSTSLQAYFSGILYLNGAAITCDQPRIAVGPTDWTETQWTPFGVAMNVAAAGTWPLNFQWQRETSPNTWVNLEDACADFDRTYEWDYEGTHTNQLRVGEQNCGGDRAGRYRVVVSNACGSVTSNAASVTFANSVIITQQPSDASACISTPTNFFAGSIGAGPVTYQWQIGDPNAPDGFADLYDGVTYAYDGRLVTIQGADSPVLGFTCDSLSNIASTYLVRCVLTAPCSAATTNPAVLTVCPADYDCNGFVNGDDFDFFIEAFYWGNDSADFDRNGFVNGDDFDYFVIAFEAGC